MNKTVLTTALSISILLVIPACGGTKQKKSATPKKLDIIEALIEEETTKNVEDDINIEEEQDEVRIKF
ncbi:MAG TPA: hypothetical protein PLU71_02100 [Candidatus Dependentiae bacterium]|nr:hypothetical protein [Candidatus Dependentiae bacterium]HRQ62622.1 hypothetical protein [Candidatus Dependentiae bacterium]